MEKQIKEKRINVRLSTENLRELDALSQLLGENYSRVIIRGLQYLSQKYEDKLKKGE